MEHSPAGRDISRRAALASAGTTIAGAVGMSPCVVRAAEQLAAAPSESAMGAKRVLRLAHLTDVHLQPEKGAADGFAACLRHAQSLKDAPGLIVTGGDCVMDVMGNDAARAKVQADLWRDILRGECGLPVENCIGNHDVWGWDKKGSNTTGGEPLWGKKWAMDLLGLARPYRSFDRAGWHFVVLDSVYPHGDGYTARLDDAQFEWLRSELEATPKDRPVLVVSHIPILAACAFFDGDNEKTGDWRIPGSYVHIDARRIKDLFLRHRNVKLCLSGHEHLIDRVDYNGVSYVCDGAVSGAWWKGDNQECDEGYGLVDLYDDGSFRHQYVSYAWTPKP